MPESLRQIDNSVAEADRTSAGGSGSGDALPPPPAPLPQIPQYEIQGLLGHGAMGVVYKAWQQRLQRPVALKMIRAGAYAALKERLRFQIEAEAVARMQHLHIVQIHDTGTHEGLDYFALEFLEGGSLREKLAAGLPRPDEAAQAIRQLALGIHYAHLRGIVHRDLKPANILLTADGVPKIVDFGLAKRLDAATETQTGSILGTPSYMSPEQVRDSRHVGPATDIYALGAIFYEMLTGRPPFQANSAAEVLDQVQHAEPLAPQKVRNGIPRDLETICLKCLKKQPQVRYATAQELADDLDRYARHEPIQARRVGPVERGRKWLRRHPVIAVLTLALACLLGGGLWFNVRLRESEEQANSRRVDTLVAYGIRLMNEGEYTEAFPWFQSALESERAGEEKKHLHRRRIGEILARIPRLVQFWTHEAPVIGVEFSPDGRRLLTTCQDGFVRVLDVRTGQLAFPPLRQEPYAIRAHFTPGGRLLVTTTPGGLMSVWNAETGQPHGLPWNADSGDLGFSRDGRLMWTRSQFAVQVWETETGRRIVGPLRHEPGEPKTVINGAAFSPDGKWIATAGHDATVRVWDCRTGQPLRRLPHPHQVWRVAFSPDGSLLASGCLDRVVRLWSAASAQTPERTFPHQAAIHVVQFSADGRRLVTAARDGRIGVWETATGRLCFLLDHKTDVVSVQLAGREGNRLVSLGGTARVWDVETGQALGPPLRHNGQVLSVAPHPDGRLLATAGQDGTVRVWDLAERTGVRSLAHGWDVSTAAFSPDGQRLAAAAEDGRVRLWDSQTGTMVFATAPSAVVSTLAFTPDGRRLLTASSNGFRVLDASSGNVLTTLPVKTSFPRVAVDRTGELVVTSAEGNSAGLWNARSFQRVARLEHESPVQFVAFSPDGRIVLTCSGATGRLWSRTGELQTKLVGHRDALTHAAFSPDGRRLATASEDHTACVWEVATGQPVTPFLLHNSRIARIGFRSDGQQVVTAGADHTARIWDATSGQALFPLLHHQGAVVSAQFNPDGRMLLTASQDRTAVVWDAVTGQQVTPPMVHQAQIVDAVFSPDGTQVATSGQDAKTRIWTLHRSDQRVEDLRRWSELLTGKRMQADGLVQELSPRELQTIWDALREKYPQDVTVP